MSITWGDVEFEGPYELEHWEPPRKAAVYAVMYKKEPVKKPGTYTIVYFGQAENLSDRGFPFGHERAQCWIDEAGSKGNVYIGLHYMPNSTQAERLRVEAALIEKYDPACNRTQ